MRSLPMVIWRERCRATQNVGLTNFLEQDQVAKLLWKAYRTRKAFKGKPTSKTNDPRSRSRTFSQSCLRYAGLGERVRATLASARRELAVLIPNTARKLLYPLCALYR